MRINRVFDIIGSSRFVPNGWNYKFTNTLWDYDFSIWHKTIEEFNKLYKNILIFEANLNLPEEIMNFLSISKLRYDENDNTVSTKEIKNTENFYFTIHPFGDIYTSLGTQCNYNENTSVFNSISTRAKKYSHAKNFFIIFDYSTEGDINPNIFYHIHDACKKNNINVKNVIFISSSTNTFELYNDYYVKEKNPTDKLKAVFYPWSILAKMKDTKKILIEDGMIYFNGFHNKNSLMSVEESYTKNRPKKAVCFNRRTSHHRLILISFLIADNLLDNSLVSFDINMIEHEYFVIDIINDNRFIKDKNLKQKCVDGFRQMKKIKKRIIDVDDINNVWGFAFEHKQNYIDSYFSIVTETLFYQPGNYISEKTWKPIQHLHPFVIVGRPSTLKYLKQLGFKTFSDFWDESYDDIQEDNKRMEVVYELISKLLNLSNNEWDNMYNKLIPILEHNRNTLLSVTEEWVSETYFNNITKLVEENDQKTYSLL